MNIFKLNTELDNVRFLDETIYNLKVNTFDSKFMDLSISFSKTPSRASLKNVCVAVGKLAIDYGLKINLHVTDNISKLVA